MEGDERRARARGPVELLSDSRSSRLDQHIGWLFRAFVQTLSRHVVVKRMHVGAGTCAARFE